MSSLRHCVVAVLILSTVCLSAQKPKRITVFPLADRTSSGAKMNISQKVADELMTKFVESGKFTVVTRENIAAVEAERNNKFGAEFDPRNAPKSGLQKVCDIIVMGQIDEFNAIQDSKEKSSVFSKKSEVNGTATLKVSISLISTTTGEILAATNARVEKTALLGTTSENAATSVLFAAKSLKVPGTSSKTGGDNAQSLIKLVDTDIAEVSDLLVQKILGGHALEGGAAVPMPKVMGIMDGLVVINKGTNGNVENGDTYDVLRSVSSGMVDPDTGKPVVVHKKICSLTVTFVDESSSQGKCVGGAASAGDELKAVIK